MKAIGIIPARYESTRLAGKPLAEIGGKPMIQHVYEQARRCELLEDVVVATDDARVARAVEHFGGKAVMTSKTHATGTDRIAEAAAGSSSPVVVNIQGDEPFVTPGMIDEVVEPMLADRNLPMCTLMHEIDETGFDDPGVVKVVTDRAGFALYFSRSLIPYPRNRGDLHVFEHIGIYAFQADFLRTFVRLEPPPLERTESLEQLRALENGYRIRVILTKSADYIPLSVDTAADLERARKLYLERSEARAEGAAP